MRARKFLLIFSIFLSLPAWGNLLTDPQELRDLAKIAKFVQKLCPTKKCVVIGIG